MSQSGELFPGTLIDLLALGGASAAFACGSTGTFYTRSFVLPRNVSFGWILQVSSSGTVTLAIELEQGFVRPVTENASDVNWTVQDNKTGTSRLFASIADTALHMTAYAPNPMPLGRLKISATGSNDASTALATAKMYCVKDNM